MGGQVDAQEAGVQRAGSQAKRQELAEGVQLLAPNIGRIFVGYAEAIGPRTPVCNHQPSSDQPIA